MASRNMTRHGANANSRRASARGARRSAASSPGTASSAARDKTTRGKTTRSKTPGSTAVHVTPAPRKRAITARGKTPAAATTASSATKSRKPKRVAARTPDRTAAARTPARTTSRTPGLRGIFAGAPRGVVIPIVIAGVLAFSVWSFYPVARVQYREERQKAKLEAEYAALKERNARLAKQVARLRTPEGVEDVARENLGLVKQGEHPVVVVDPNADTTAAAVPTIDSEPEVSAPRGPWTAALDAFFGYDE